MRSPFLDGARLVVVLYREPWGETQWTRVEATAIQDGCLKRGFQRLFFVMLDKSAPPLWVPSAQVRFNYSDFGLEKAVGVIKARVQDEGGTIAPLTARRRAELSRRETQFLEEKEQLRPTSGCHVVQQEALKLFAAIESVCAEVNAGGDAFIDVLVVNLRVSHSGCELTVREFDGRFAMPGERLYHPDGEPKMLSKIRFLPELSRARECGWADQAQPQTFLACERLANEIVSRFVDLAARSDRGELRRASRRSGRTSIYRSI